MDEELFRHLVFLEKDSGIDMEEFIKLGYFIRCNDTVYRTEKLEEELKEFIEVKKESLFAAIKELGSAKDINKVMELAGIQQFITFSILADELVREGRIVKDKENICLLK
ncbi:hypothetical protein [Pelotomaculum propionicicum]|uniref:Uncharacterized protein n=1 Tax=Pelotomaculum propionicicum TaxID=258475 RepID=A0A4Y7RLZ2_9FIRM|nr:hypothetical protein [Pelotomaculum propionicicum]NLI13682.1 hypothetical protein [Peptococcaceae bacterium]TEB09995.1 hypothetical protein Pmgp_02689 [Pelotomaculum propionicicum]